MFVADPQGQYPTAFAETGIGSSIGLYRCGEKEKSYARVCWKDKSDLVWDACLTTTPFTPIGKIHFTGDCAEFRTESGTLLATSSPEGIITLVNAEIPIAQTFLEDGDDCPHIGKVRQAVGLTAIAEAMVAT